MSGRFTTIRASNRGLAQWGGVLGDPAVATALLDRMLCHDVVIQIAGSSHPMRERAARVAGALRTMPARSICHRNSAVVVSRRREILITK